MSKRNLSKLVDLVPQENHTAHELYGIIVDRARHVILGDRAPDEVYGEAFVALVQLCRIANAPMSPFEKTAILETYVKANNVEAIITKEEQEDPNFIFDLYDVLGRLASQLMHCSKTGIEISKEPMIAELLDILCAAVTLPIITKNVPLYDILKTHLTKKGVNK